jgi:lipoyl(octanoyl) transferase
VARLATTLSAALQPTSWPEFNEEEVEALTEQYGTPEWVEYR